MNPLRVFAGLFALLAVSNALKPLKLGDSVGFVLFGTRLDGTANLIAGPLFAVYLAVYAYGILNQRKFALGMGVAYAIYVVVNLVTWTLYAPQAAESGMLFGLVYTAIAVGVSSGAAYLLYQARDELV